MGAYFVGIRVSKWRYFWVFLTTLGPGLALGVAGVEGKQVVASIKPLALITEAIVAGSDIEVDTLLPPTNSPHSYALKISDARRLQAASLVIWLGKDAEPYINPGKTKNNLALLDAIEQHALITEAEDEGDQHHHLVDPHIWLDPILAQEIAALVAERLITLYPDQRPQFEKNLVVFRDSSEKLDQKINSLLDKHRNTGFLSYHNAYAYFVRRYSLNQLGAVQEQVGSTMSVKHLLDLQMLVKPGEPACLFREPQFAKASLPELGNGRRFESGILDPLGIEASSYGDLLERLTNQMVSCLRLIDTK